MHNVYANYIVEYHDKIERGQIIAGKWIKKIYKILVDGIKSGDWDFDAKKANKAIQFIENFCHHSKGRNDLFKLELWQKAIVSAIFGILDKKTHRRQFREIFLLVGRKNGKSLFAAAIMAYVAYIDGEYGSELYCLAPKLDQADIVYDSFYKITQAEEELAEVTKKRRSDIYIEELNTTIKKIAFNAKKADGFNPTMTTNDEMEAWPGDQGLKQYEVMVSGTGARTEPITLSTSTAGYVNDGIFDELMKRSTAFLKGSSKERRLLPFLYMIDDLEKWNTKEELAKANPNLGVSVQWEFFEEQIAIALQSLSKKAEFMTKYCNIKQNSSIAWLDYETVAKAAGQPYTLDDFRGCYCVAGIDLSRTTDLTAVSLVIEKGGKNHIITQFFMPQERYNVAIDEEGVPYNIFKEQGYLTISGEHQVNYKDVFAWFVRLIKEYKIRPLKVGYDRYCAGYLVEEMKEAGFHMDDVYQGTNLTPVLNTFEGDLKDGMYLIGENNLLKSHLLNVAVQIQTDDSRMKPVKIEKRAHIDGAVSIFDALAVKMKYHKEIGRQLQNAA
ncbi:MAG: terminase TerL endonuclease subunit [Dorea phocaeensis]|jgi:phage terminase large subunit-like protein|nr:MAG TPA: Large Terminase [Caudoviricetes sp.]